MRALRPAPRPGRCPWTPLGELRPPQTPRKRGSAALDKLAEPCPYAVAGGAPVYRSLWGGAHTGAAFK